MHPVWCPSLSTKRIIQNSLFYEWIWTNNCCLSCTDVNDQRCWCTWGSCKNSLTGRLTGHHERDRWESNYIKNRMEIKSKIRFIYPYFAIQIWNKITVCLVNLKSIQIEKFRFINIRQRLKTKTQTNRRVAWQCTTDGGMTQQSRAWFHGSEFEQTNFLCQ